MFEYIRRDAASFRIGRSGRASLYQRLLFWVFSFGMHAIVVYRYGQWLRRVFSGPAGRPLGWLLWWGSYQPAAFLVRCCYDIDLQPSARIGPGFRIGHFGGIRLAHCVLGEQCSVQQQVRIGPDPEAEDDRGPVIGDRVWIGGHSVIRGPVTVGDGATIGAGALVVRDVPARCLVLGRPARVIRKEFDNSGILTGAP